MGDWQDLRVGFSECGFQVWCNRHQMNVLHFDFRGNRIVVTAGALAGIIWPSTVSK